MTKINVVDIRVQSNHVLYEHREETDDSLCGDQIYVIGKYALDEYTSELMLDRTNTLVLHDTC